MKKLIPLLVLLGGAATGFAQGTIAFNNAVTFATVDPSGGAHLVYMPGTLPGTYDPSSTGNGLRGTQYVAELYAGTDANSLSPVTASTSRFRSTTSASRGKWGNAVLAGTSNLSVPIPFDVGTTVFLQVRAWDFSEAGTFEAATTKGASSTFTYKVPPGSNPPGDFYMEGLQAFALVVPEPSAVALSVLGVAGLLLIRRRK